MPRPSPLTPDLDRLAQALGSIAPSWRGHVRQALPVQATGFAALDALLPGGGWPVGALTELLPVTDGIGEISLLLPALHRLCQAQRQVILLDPPFMPNPPALHTLGLPLSRVLWVTTHDREQRAWAAAQLLREPATGAVLLWSPQQDDRGLRKLQLAAEAGASLAFLYRDIAQRQAASPAALRLELHPAGHALEVQLRKARGGPPGTARILLSRPGQPALPAPSSTGRLALPALQPGTDRPAPPVPPPRADHFASPASPAGHFTPAPLNPPSPAGHFMPAPSH